ncbi:MAG: hypothetical protein ACRDTN_04240 [Mycobacterium sp.]
MAMIQFSKIQQSFEESKLGEIVISGLVALFLTTSVIWNMPPDSAIRSALVPLVTPIGQATGLSQNLAPFAPDPVSTNDSLEVHVIMADGTSRVWKLEPPGRGLKRQFGWKHYRQFSYRLIEEPDVRPAYLHWVVRKLTGPGERAVRVELIDKREQMLPPNAQGPRTIIAKKLLVEDLGQ